MIVKSEDAFNMVCPMSLAGEGSSRCGGDKCMAWRDVGGGRGFCGMCPISHILAQRVAEDLEND